MITCNIKLFQADNVTRFHIRDNDTTHVAPSMVTSDVLTIIQITYFVFRSISVSFNGWIVGARCLTNVIRYGSHDTVIDVILPCLDRRVARCTFHSRYRR